MKSGTIVALIGGGYYAYSEGMLDDVIDKITDGTTDDTVVDPFLGVWEVYTGTSVGYVDYRDGLVIGWSSLYDYNPDYSLYELLLGNQIKVSPTDDVSWGIFDYTVSSASHKIDMFLSSSNTGSGAPIGMHLELTYYGVSGSFSPTV